MNDQKELDLGVEEDNVEPCPECGEAPEDCLCDQEEHDDDDGSAKAADPSEDDDDDGN